MDDEEEIIIISPSRKYKVPCKIKNHNPNSSYFICKRRYAKYCISKGYSAKYFVLTPTKGILEPEETVTEEDRKAFEKSDFKNEKVQEKLRKVLEKQKEEFDLSRSSITFLGGAELKKYPSIVQPVFGKVNFPLKDWGIGQSTHQLNRTIIQGMLNQLGIKAGEEFTFSQIEGAVESLAKELEENPISKGSVEKILSKMENEDLISKVKKDRYKLEENLSSRLPSYYPVQQRTLSSKDTYEIKTVSAKRHKSKCGHTCHSIRELEICNYLLHRGIHHAKPKSARKGEYYRGHRFVPDWVIDGVVVEYFGLKGEEDYDKKSKIKRKSKLRNKEYIFIEPGDDWKSILSERFGNLKTKQSVLTDKHEG